MMMVVVVHCHVELDFHAQDNPPTPHNSKDWPCKTYPRMHQPQGQDQ